MSLMTGFPDGGTIWGLWDNFSLGGVMDHCRCDLKVICFPDLFCIPFAFWSPCHKEIPQQPDPATVIFAQGHRTKQLRTAVPRRNLDLYWAFQKSN